jgi:hypothetical protein
VKHEIAKVWRGANRRYFSKKAAERSHAVEIIRKRCECEPYERHVCDYHKDPVRYERMVRLLLVMYVRRAYRS